MARKPKRSDELSTRKAVREKFLDVMKDVEKGASDQRTRTDDIMDQWDAYNCNLGAKQFYNGNSQIFVPSITDAVNARKTRFVNQIFPQSGRNVEVVSANGDIPHALVALLEHYVRVSKMRTEIVPALTVSGDVEGQYSLYVGWRKTKRWLTRKVMKQPKSDGIEIPDLEPVETIEEEMVEEGAPETELIADPDLIVLPATANNVDEAVEVGGSVTIIRRWSKAKIKKLIEEDEIVEAEGEALIENMRAVSSGEKPDVTKELASNAGIKRGGGFALVYETWTKMKVGDDWRLCRGYYAGESQVLGIKQCPYWCDRVPVISAPVEKQRNVFKGKAPIARALDLQYLLNDTINEGADTAHYSAMPIIMTDPEKNPRVSSMVLGLAALWETSPKDTSFAQFPELWRQALERADAIEKRIQQSLSVSPAMMPQSSGKAGAKRNQAEISLEQQVDILTTADAVINIEEGILTPWLQRVIEYDAQFRDKELLVRAYGDMGRKAIMHEIEPIQMERAWEFLWFGVEAARNAAQVQQQIGMANVLKEVPPQLYQGYRLDMAPLMTQLTENVFGPRLAPLIFISTRDELTVDPMQENEMLEHGFTVPTHPGDDDQTHMQAHMQALQEGGDPHGTVRDHLLHHQAQLQTKAMAQAQQQQGQQPGPGGGGPAPGASPGQPHAAKGPPGQIHKDRLPAAGGVTAPRKT